MKKLILFLIPLFFIFACSSNREEVKKQQKKLEPKILLTAAQVEKSGFERIDGENFELFFLKDGFFLLNSMDRNVIRYNSPGNIRQYKAYGEGPAEFMMPYRLFKFDDQTVGILDVGNSKVLFFDQDLDYKKEVKVHPQIYMIAPLNDRSGFLAYGFVSGNLFAILDRDFQIKETFVSQETKSRLPRMTIIHLNTGRLLNNGKYASTNWMYTEKKCRVDIYGIDTKEISLTLEWEQDKALSRKDRLGNKNLYFSKYMFEFENSYLIINNFIKYRRAPFRYDFILFDKKGKLIYRDKNFRLDVIRVHNNPDDTLYYMTENGDLAYIRIDQLVKPS